MNNVKVVFFNIPAYGHTNPTLQVVSELVSRGHDVRYYSYDMMKKSIEMAGAQFVSCDQCDFQNQLSKDEITRMGKDIVLSTNVLVNTTLALDGMIFADMKEYHPDCIVSDSMALWGKLIALKLNIPYICSTTTFAFNQYSSKMLKYTFKEMISLMFSTRKANKILRKLVDKGYPIDNILSIISNDNHTDTIVYTSKMFQPYSDTFSDKYEFVGPLIRKLDYQVERSKQKTIYISLGTVNNQFLSFYNHCIEAFENTNYDVIISIGNYLNIEDLKPFSNHIKVERFVNQMEVLQCCDVFITHCGMNSVNEALYYGVPFVLFPQTPEQNVVAKRVEELEAGIYLKNNSVIEIKNAVEKILNQSKYQTNAICISQDFHQCLGAKQAADKIEQKAMEG